ncbi:hypothetical protein GIB67_010588 [Kingdonia uniflora]|uniref:Uncharacterized protein n=1 Tax=Kingdonia uniflora TaxID=39325 RepID=A0A7J7MB44_9MAGN|nr:hypothetical protein GIB67_010588 [Kingdonia uniflora]
MYDRRNKAIEWNQDDLVPRVKEHIAKMETFYGQYHPEGAGDGCHVAIGANVSILMKFRVSWIEYYSPYHRVSSYVETYKKAIYPIVVVMAEGPNVTNPTQVLAPQAAGPPVNPRPVNMRTWLDQLESKMQALGGIIDQVTTLEEQLDGFTDDQAHMGEHLITLEIIVEGNMATHLDQVTELSSKVNLPFKRMRSSYNDNKGKNGDTKLEIGETKGKARAEVGEQVRAGPRIPILGGSTTGHVTMVALPHRPCFRGV